MLTNAQAHAAKPRPARYEITCGALPGFILRVLPTGKKVFFIRYRGPDGRDHRERLGLLAPGFGVEEARRAALKVLAFAGEEASAPEAEPRTKARGPRGAASASHAAERPAPRAAELDEPPFERCAPEPTARLSQDSTRGHRAPLRLLAPADASTPTPAPLTLASFVERFIHEHVDVYLKPETARHYKSSLRNHILPALGSKPLAEITTSDIERLHRSLQHKRSTANYARTVLSVVFAKAELWDVTTGRNPAERASRFEEHGVERFLSPDERRRLEAVLAQAAACKPCQPGYIQPDAIWAVRLLALTGMRHSEICDLKWDQVDWNRGILRLPDSKTGKRDIVVSDQVIDLLREIAVAKRHPRRGRVVCSRTGDKLHSLGRTWRRLRELAGLPDLRIHDLRHSVASDAIMQGVPLEVVGKMLGHRNYKTTQRYAHIADTALRDAVNLTSKTIIQASRSRTVSGRPERGA